MQAQGAEDGKISQVVVSTEDVQPIQVTIIDDPRFVVRIDEVDEVFADEERGR